LQESKITLQNSRTNEERSEIGNKIIITKQYYENYIREIPQQANIQGTLEIVGIDYQGNRTQNPTLVIEENEVTVKLSIASLYIL